MNGRPAADIRQELDRFRERYRSFNRDIESNAVARGWCTPNRVVLEKGPVRLREFIAGPEEGAVPVLIVYSHVNRADVIDIDPDHSMVRRLAETGNRVFLMDWAHTTDADREKDLSVYVLDAIGDALDFVSDATGFERINLVGICQGGTFALSHACLRPGRVRRLGLVVTPVDFHAGDSLIRLWSRHIRFTRLAARPVNVPGELITLMFRSARPFDDLRRHVRRIDGHEEDSDFEFSLRMDRWVHDCPDQPGRAFAQFMGGLYGENRLVRGTFEVRGEAVDLNRLEAPVLNVFAESDHLVPPASSTALGAHVDPGLYGELPFGGGHIGLIVSARAQREVHPELGRWLSAGR